ncbi:MAG TPA: hypothetical protein VJ111_18030 [Chitinophagaceae bacterium]|nr:hypothetical protein [Chitinophagaceae bacterium]
MKEYFELDPNEKKQEWLLLSLAILVFLIIIKGVYNQQYNIDQDRILLPLLFFIGGTFFFIYGLNGLGKGNLTPKWTPFLIFQISIFLTKRFTSLSAEKARQFVKRSLGVLGLLIGIGLLIISILTLIK